MPQLEQSELIASPFNENPFGQTKIPISAIPGSDAWRTLGWCGEIEQEAGTFIASQEGYDRIEPAIKSIIGASSPVIQTRSPLSQTKTNRVADVAEQLTAILTDTKPFWDYETANKRWEQHAAIYGKLSTWWYTQQNIDQRWPRSSSTPLLPEPVTVIWCGIRTSRTSNSSPSIPATSFPCGHAISIQSSPASVSSSSTGTRSITSRTASESK